MRVQSVTITAQQPDGSVTMLFDFSFHMWTDAELDDLRRRGYVGGIGYVSRPPSNPAKNLTPARIAQLHAHGLAVGVVCENSQADPLAGYGRGVLRGQEAAADVTALGFPPEVPILWAADYNVTADNLVATTGFGNGFADAVEAVGRRMGPYGDLDIIRQFKGRSVCNWLMASSSFSPPGAASDPLVHVVQHVSGSTPGMDRNTVNKPITLWLPHDEPDPVAPTLPIIPPTGAPQDPTEQDNNMIPAYYRSQGYNEVIYGYDWVPALPAGATIVVIPLVNGAVHPAFARIASKAGVTLTPTADGS